MLVKTLCKLLGVCNQRDECLDIDFLSVLECLPSLRVRFVGNLLNRGPLARKESQARKEPVEKHDGLFAFAILANRGQLIQSGRLIPPPGRGSRRVAKTKQCRKKSAPRPGNALASCSNH